MDDVWSSLGIQPTVAKTLSDDFGFSQVTPVQKTVIPMFSGNKDVCVEACTGSGKTLAFLIPIFDKLLRDKDHKGLHSLIIEPSRELALQVYEVAQKLNASQGFEIACAIGGRTREGDMERLNQGLKILIGTPGRLHDLASNNTLTLKSVEVLVLDEADRLLDLGFTTRIHQIIELLPRQRRTGLFSATMNTQIQALVKAGLRNPAFVSVKLNPTTKHQEIPSGISNYYKSFESTYDKLPFLIKFLKRKKKCKIIVFMATCASSTFYTSVLQMEGISALRLHGRMKQTQREKVYAQFEEQTCGALLTTDLIARGIDLPDVHWIVQFDPPQNPDFFVHRIGRTARAGRTGSTITFLRQSETTFIDFMSAKGVNIAPYPKEYKCRDGVYKRILAEHMGDRDLYEAAQRAFVAFVRSYKEHDLGFIFPFKQLDLGVLARSFCLLRIPRVKEILGKQIEGFTQSSVDPETIPYKDSGKEAKRLEALAEKAKPVLPVKRKAPEKDHRTTAEKRSARRENLIQEWDEYGNEEGIVKRFKRGKITKEKAMELLGDSGKWMFRKKRH